MDKRPHINSDLTIPIHVPSHLNLENISIDTLKLSVRASNCLKQAGIEYISQLDGITPEALFQIRNMGAKSVAEICEILDSLGNFDLADDSNWGAANSTDSLEKEVASMAVIADSQGILHENMRIEELQLSVRAYNVLKRNGINTVKDLMVLSEDVLRTFRNLGNKSINEIITERDFYVQQYELTLVANLSDTDKVLCKSIAAELTIILPSMPEEKLSIIVGGVLSNYRESHPNTDIEHDSKAIFDELISNVVIRNGIKTTIYERLDEWSSKPYNEIAADMLSTLYKAASIESVVSEMHEARLIDIADGFISKHHDSVLDVVEKIGDDRNREILRSRLYGQTLEDIGQAFCLTRERVRQISLKELRKIRNCRNDNKECTLFIEDRYSNFFQKYIFSKEDFCTIFKVPQTTYYYLLSVYNRGELALSEFLDCGYLSDEEKHAFYKQNMRSKILIAGEQITKSKKDLAQFVLKKFCQETVTLAQFLEYYNATLADFELNNEKRLKVNAFSLGNILSSSMSALWKQGRRLRYYNIKEYDYTEFLDTLNLAQYQDVEYSAYKFFRDYPELMKEYDIQDEYELHNLLKKILSDNNELGIVFDRMPTLKFGNPNRDTQVTKLFLAHAPISNIDLANLYEEQYGVQSQTVLANYFEYLYMYLHDGTYTFDFPRMPEEQYMQMKQWCVDEFYFIRDLEQLYLTKITDADSKYFSPYNIKKFGYRVYSDYVIKDSFSSASDYFHCLLTEQATVNLKEITLGIRTIPSYLSEFQKLKDSYEILEINPTCCINVSQIIKRGYSKSDIEDYCDKVYRFVRPGEYFTIKSLQKRGFFHQLNQLEYDDWFYGSLLASAKNGLQCKRMGGTRAFLNSARDFSVPGLIKYIMRVKGISDIGVDDLTRLLWEDYGIHFEAQKISTMVKENILEFDIHNGSIYYDSCSSYI